MFARRLTFSVIAVSALAMSGTAMARSLIYSAETGITHYDNTYVLPNYSHAVNEATGGLYSIEIHPSSALVAPQGAVQAVGDGAIDAAGPVYTYTPSLLPAMTFISQLPGSTLEAAAAAATETMLFDCEQCQEEQEENGVFVLVTNSTENFQLFCSHMPVATLDDARGIRLRAIGAFARIGAELGMTPVNIPFNEAYDALHRGQADCMAIGTSTVDSLQFWDVLGYVTVDLPLGTGHNWSLFTINRDLWNEMEPEHRRAFVDNAPILLADDAYYAQLISREALALVSSRGDVELVPASEDLRAALDAAKESQTLAAIETAEERGVRDPEAVAEAFARNLAKWDAIYDEIGADGDWTPDQYAQYQDRLRTEIFSRIAID